MYVLFVMAGFCNFRKINNFYKYINFYLFGTMQCLTADMFQFKREGLFVIDFAIMDFVYASQIIRVVPVFTKNRPIFICYGICNFRERNNLYIYIVCFEN